MREVGKGCGNFEWADDDSWLTAWRWIINRCAPPWGKLILSQSAFIGFYSNLCRVQDVVFPFIHLVDLLMVFLGSCLCSHSGETFLGVASDIPWRHDITANVLMLWPLQLFCPIFHNVPWASGAGVLWMHPFVPGSTTLPFDWLRFSVLLFLYCKEKFLWWVLRSTLICGYKNKYLEYS